MLKRAFLQLAREQKLTLPQLIRAEHLLSLLVKVLAVFALLIAISAGAGWTLAQLEISDADRADFHRWQAQQQGYDRAR